MSGNERKYIDEAFESNWIAPLGPNIDAFESELASYVSIKGAAAVSSGTAAIHLALELLGVGKGDLVCCPSFTFIASANPISYLGAEPIFIDSEPDTWNMSPEALEQAMMECAAEGKLPKAVIVVHLYGCIAKMTEIMSVCNRYDVPVIEDAAESLGSTYNGIQSGTFGHFGIFSFNGNKIITTSGGGMLVSNDLEAINKARFLATQARDAAQHYQHSVMGYNYRLSNILAGIGRAQLEVLDERVEARRNVFLRYVNAFRHYDNVQFMPEQIGSRSNRWLTTFTITEEDSAWKIQELLNELSANNIEARPLWKPLHQQPLFEGTRFYPHPTLEAASICEKLFQSGICLPSGSNLGIEDQMRVIEVVERVIAETVQVTIQR
ncbi:aminotransferase class I/II-fold pyridoxal phosphate-dependent enzyme [Paenibacillus sp. GSMTC-2017]|uniref:aminotransferase class I/II-fold pyridoxal phosphate-dependent enzyme n=1 Tax=Paenibacillus sp. GSMTC-2017 TaxID=2794350 RepID=UPI0018D9E7EB|nr:aminotransferase class I/II-fold pyridoxal phosphate-dependent enzyme [Paenibacillus sp. GSMTC-2017]MBH5317302.1 aminotransferase class I/II-fold pyridoxal phosphate-dependent enzyme [Paenibacillus sp. GSMTC-2017]